MFERQVDEAYQRLPDAAEAAAGQAGLLAKLRAIASREGFDVERLLGSGGMGAVVLARDRKLDRRVALKFLLSSSGAVETLRREAERAGRLAHENIVQIYSWHSAGGLTFFSMEYVEGETFDEYLHARKRVAPHEVLRIMAEAASGVAAAHEQGILHRDIKPQNILIARNGRVKVTDFGLSSTLDEVRRLAEERGVSGTVGFMAPEQARGEEESFASDTYSLTATLYYGLTGRMPFESTDDTTALLEINRSGRIVPLFTVRENLPQSVYRFVARGLSREKLRRYPDARVFRRELEQVMLGLGDASRARGLVSRLAAVLRHRAFWAGLTVGLVAGMLIALALAVVMLDS